jgi:hypothetical protein
LRHQELAIVGVTIVAIVLTSFSLTGIVNLQCIFGCTSSHPVLTVQLNGGTLFSGPLPTAPTCQAANSAYIVLALNNLGGATNILGMNILPGSSLNTTVTAYYLKGSNNICTQISATDQPRVNANTITNLSIYFGGQVASALAKNQTYNYIISFANGQSISGSLIAQ